MSEVIKQFEEVLLTDGRSGAVVEIFGEQDTFEVDVGTTPADWETITVKRGEIEKVLS